MIHKNSAVNISLGSGHNTNLTGMKLVNWHALSWISSHKDLALTLSRSSPGDYCHCTKMTASTFWGDGILSFQGISPLLASCLKLLYLGGLVRNAILTVPLTGVELQEVVTLLLEIQVMDLR